MFKSIKGYFKVFKGTSGESNEHAAMKSLKDFESKLDDAYHKDGNQKTQERHVKEYKEHCLNTFGDKYGIIHIDKIMTFFQMCLTQTDTAEDGTMLLYGREKLRGGKSGNNTIQHCSIRRYIGSLTKEETSQREKKLIPWDQKRFVEEERFDKLNTSFRNSEHKACKVQVNMKEKEIPHDFDKQLVTIVRERPTGDCLNTLCSIISALNNSQVLYRPEGQKNLNFSDMLVSKLPAEYLEFRDVFDLNNKFCTHCIEVFSKDKGHRKNTAANNLLSKYILASRYGDHCLLAYIGLAFLLQFYNGDDEVFNLADAMDTDMHIVKKFQKIPVMPMDTNSIASNFKTAYEKMGLQHAGKKLNIGRKHAQQRMEALASIAILQMPQVESSLVHHRDGMLGGGSSSNGEVSRVHYLKNLHVQVLLAAHDWLHNNLLLGDSRYLIDDLTPGYTVDDALTWLAGKQAELKGVKEQCKVLIYKEMLVSIRFIVEIALRAAPGIMALSGPSLNPLWELPIFKSDGFKLWKIKMDSHSSLDLNTTATIVAPATTTNSTVSKTPVPPPLLSPDSVDDDALGELLKQARSFAQVTNLWTSLLKVKEVEGRGAWRSGKKNMKSLYQNRRPLIWYVFCTWSKQIHPRISNWLTPVLVAEWCDEKMKSKGWSTSAAIKYIREHIKLELTKDLPTPSPIGSSGKRYNVIAVKEEIMAILFE